MGTVPAAAVAAVVNMPQPLATRPLSPTQPPGHSVERILEAIDQLRRRKARPDFQRICHCLFRRYDTVSAQTQNDLQWCVEHQLVSRVEYKGNISYRNPARKVKNVSRPPVRLPRLVPRPPPPTAPALHQQQQPQQIVAPTCCGSLQFSQLLINAFGELVVQEPDYLQYGVPEEQICAHILAKDNVRYTNAYISMLLDIELKAGTLIKTAEGNFLMGPIAAVCKESEASAAATTNNLVSGVAQPSNVNKKSENEKENDEEDDDQEPEEEEMPESNDRDHAGGVQRIGGRSKKAKKVFDPSDTHVPKKRGRPLGSLNRATLERQLIAKLTEDVRPESRVSSSSSSSSREQNTPVCSVCNSSTTKKGTNDRMVPCTECCNRAHASCLNGDDMMLRLRPDNTWQCPYCKTCVICFEPAAPANNLIVCNSCVDAYHIGCHRPPISKDNIKAGSNQWFCYICDANGMSTLNKSHELKAVVKQDTHHRINQFKLIEVTGRDIGGGIYLTPTPPPQLSPQLKAGATSKASTIPETNRTVSPTDDDEEAIESDKESDDDDETHLPDEDDEDYDEDDEMDRKFTAGHAPVQHKSFDPDLVDPSIPDATFWSYNDVYNYFKQYFPREAIIFKEEKIDGRSLLLLKRRDVLSNMRLKLGPALRIYRHVVMLQVRRDDPSLYWL